MFRFAIIKKILLWVLLFSHIFRIHYFVNSIFKGYLERNYHFQELQSRWHRLTKDTDEDIRYMIPSIVYLWHLSLDVWRLRRICLDFCKVAAVDFLFFYNPMGRNYSVVSLVSDLLSRSELASLSRTIRLVWGKKFWVKFLEIFIIALSNNETFLLRYRVYFNLQ